jgi:photosystem II stability/assembly factor-like uncharacterized protein
MLLSQGALFGKPLPAGRVDLISPGYDAQGGFSTNRVIASREGRVYLINQNTLFRMQRDEGDVWERVAEGVATASFDPRNEKVIYLVGTDNQVTKSLDGGGRWVSINNGLPRAKINFITVSPANSDDVFAGTELGLYKTSDAGFSWEPTPLRSATHAFYINPTNKAIRYALVGDGSVVASADGGETWNKSDAGLPVEIITARGKPAVRTTVKVANLFLVSQGRTYLLAATFGKGLFRSDDNGASWRQSGAGLGQGDQFSSIYVGDSEVVLAGTALARSGDGVNWTKLPVKTARFAPSTFEGAARTPNGGGLLVLFRYGDDSQDGAARIGYVDTDGSLVGLNYGLLPRSNVTSMWSGQYAGRRALFATVSNSTPTITGSAQSIKAGMYYFVTGSYYVDTGTYFSVNDGVSWEYLLSSECGNAVAARRGDPKDLWMYGDGPCLLRLQGEELRGAKARGTQFQAANDSVSKVVLDPADRTLLYYTAGVNENSLYRYKYNPALNEGQTVDLNVPASDLVVCEDNPKLILAGVGKFSADGGWTWQNKSAALNQYLTRNYGEGYRRGDLTLLSCRAGEFRVLVYHYDSQLASEAFWVMRSNNLGDSWEVAGSYKGQLKRLFINPDDSSNMFVVVQTFVKAGYSTRSDAIRVLETKDSGNTWQEVYAYRLSKEDEYHENEIVNVVSQVKADVGRSLFVGGVIGLWRSDDEGKSWYRLGGIRQPARAAVRLERDGREGETPPDVANSTSENPLDELLPISKRLSEATISGDRATVESYLTDDFVYRDVGNRKSMDRAKYLSKIKRDKSIRSYSCHDYEWRADGGQTLLSGICEYDVTSLIFTGVLHVRQRFTDRFVRQNGGWKLAGIDTIVLPNSQ